MTMDGDKKSKTRKIADRIKSIKDSKLVNPKEGYGSPIVKKAVEVTKAADDTGKKLKKTVNKLKGKVGL